MPATKTRKNLGPEVYIPMIMLITGSAIAVTTLLLRTSRFASIENRTDAVGPLYDDLAPALPMERWLLVAGIIIAMAGLVFLIVVSVRARLKPNADRTRSRSDA